MENKSGTMNTKEWSDTYFEDIREAISMFAFERDWIQFHSPRNLVLALLGEVGELSEIFQWAGEDCNNVLEDPRKRVHVAQEIADCSVYTLRIGERCGIDVGEAIRRKLEIDEKKYPAPLAQSRKPYEVSSDFIAEIDCDDATITDPFGGWMPNRFEPTRRSILEFGEARGWDEHFSIRNLIFSLGKEAGSLCAFFQWRGNDKEELLFQQDGGQWFHLSERVADCAMTLFRLADRCGFDLGEEMRKKLHVNALKYPPQRVKGSSKKYNEYDDYKESPNVALSSNS